MQRTELKTTNIKLSWALGASVLLHVLILLSLGGGVLSGPAPEPGVMMAYLTMPAPVPVKAPGMKAAAGKMTAAQPVQAGAKHEALPGPAKVKPQPTPDLLTLEKKPVMKLPIDPAAGGAREAGIEDGKPDPSELKTEGAPEAMLSESKGIAVNNSQSTAPVSEVLVVNPRSSIRNSESYLLAFAGDPASLGMLRLNTPGPDLVGAGILSLPEPVYPLLSRKRGEEGRVILEVTVSARGEVRRAQVETSSSYTRLDRAALKAVQGAAFSPATEYGTPVESVMKVAYRFELEGR